MRNHAYYGQKVTAGPLEQQKLPGASLANVSLGTQISSSDFVPVEEDEGRRSFEPSQKHSSSDDGVSVDVDMDKDEDIMAANDWQDTDA